MKNKIENDVQYFLAIEKLKKVKRYKPVKPLHESVADHVFMSLFLANFFMNNVKLNLDFRKVFNLILCHDFVELGMKYDIPAPQAEADESLKKYKYELEVKKIKNLSETFNKPYLEQYFNEFENRLSREAKFARLIDRIEPKIHAISNHCNGFVCNEDFEFIIGVSKEEVKDFPELKKYIDEIQKQLYIEYDNFKNKKTISS